MQASYELTHFPTFVADIAATFRSAIERAGLTLIVDAPRSGDSLVQLDRDLWEKIVLNLLSNAFKHTFAGEIRVRAAVRNGMKQGPLLDGPEATRRRRRPVSIPRSLVRRPSRPRTGMRPNGNRSRSC